MRTGFEQTQGVTNEKGRPWWPPFFIRSIRTLFGRLFLLAFGVVGRGVVGGRSLLSGRLLGSSLSGRSFLHSSFCSLSSRSLLHSSFCSLYGHFLHCFCSDGRCSSRCSIGTTSTAGAATALALGLGFVSVQLVEVNQLNHTHLGIVTQTVPRADDAGVATLAGTHLGPTSLNSSVTACLSRK